MNGTLYAPVYVIHWIGGRVGLEAVLEAELARKDVSFETEWG
jgi:hypothetical protein